MLNCLKQSHHLISLVVMLQDMRLLGQMSKGMYVDDPLERINPETLATYYDAGEDAQVYSNLNNGGNAGDSALVHLVDEVGRLQEKNIRHKALSMPRHGNPFAEAKEVERMFWEAISQLQDGNIVPRFYGVHDEELEGGYPDQETIKYGGRGKSLRIQLPVDIWLPRAIFWAQAASILDEYLRTTT